MYFLTLVTDYDGTIANHGRVEPEVCDALKRFKETGRRVVLVTGRDLDDLRRVFPDLSLFDRVVAENGAVLYNPASTEERGLGPPPDEKLVARLQQLDVRPLAVGRTIVATWEPNQTIVLDAIRDLGLELQIVFNKGAVMVLPPNINKASGALAALAELGISAHNAIGVGDAENDHALLRACGCSAAVANALPVIKQSVDVVLNADHGAGAIELIDRIIQDDARLLPAHRNGIRLGEDEAGDVWLEPQRGTALIAGSSGSGKSTVATALTERMVERSFQFCIFDPEGDYDGLEHAVSVGDARTPPKQAEVLQLLKDIGTNVVVNLQGLGLADRPPFFARLLGDVLDMRARVGHPHWLIIDEAHHLVPAARDDGNLVLNDAMNDAILVTVHPEAVSLKALRSVGVVAGVGKHAMDTLTAFADAVDERLAGLADPPANEDEILAWVRGSGEPVRRIRTERPRQARTRHTQKYAEGDLGEDNSFYFRGPRGALNLRAQNLMLFLQIAEGVDDATWAHHLRRRDYSSWFREIIKDSELAGEVAKIESDRSLGPETAGCASPKR